MSRIVQLSGAALMVLILLCSSQLSEQAATFQQELPRVARSIEEEKCIDNTPCGWAIYKPFTRTIENYMRNTCNCPDGLKCVRIDDDLSISAYVYRCRKVV
ncbi:uncharacterized protein LOC128737462 [Sabethes cyaneus]|uniref:uncharacterized protein LOC128737462 n=1 Tax=Sabethes cyaneus TaxID=53552 RepID=UPI00237DF56D|nr:uncharacterized protein LOC128737462 [Sabethes cyaneus]